MKPKETPELVTGANGGAFSNRTRRLLLAGFGGLLLLMAFTGLDDLRVLREIQTRNDRIRGEFLNRNRLLNQIRSDLYLSGTYVRDYLTEPDPERAEVHRHTLQKDRQDMTAALRQYTNLLRSGEQGPFANLDRALATYWILLEPVLQWSPADRQARAFNFLRDEVYPRRAAMLALADEIGALNEQQLNAGNREVAELFSGFEWRLIATVLATMALGLLLALNSITRILVLERQSATRFQENAAARDELKRLSARLVEAQESERRAISRELHDEVGQSLSALVVGLSNLSASVTTHNGAEWTRQIDELKDLAKRSVGVVRNVTLLLRPSMLDDLGLVPALQWQAREIAKRGGMVVNFTSDENIDDLADDQRTAVYRVVQEALHNCEKHAHAREVRVTLGTHQESLLLSIQDDGSGFNPGTQRGLGIRGMQERIENLGGIFNVESEAGKGSLITVRLPLRHPSATLIANAHEDD